MVEVDRQRSWWFAHVTREPEIPAASTSTPAPASRSPRPSPRQWAQLLELVRLDRLADESDDGEWLEGREVQRFERTTLRALQRRGWAFVSVVGLVYLKSEGEAAFERERSRRWWRARERAQIALWSEP